MPIPNQSLLFNIDADELEAIRQSLDATTTDMIKAYNRALNRTAITLKSMSAKLLKDELQVRKLKTLRQRLKSFKAKGEGKDLGSLRLWYGLNDLPVSRLKGRVKRQGTKKHPKGASFIPAASRLGTQHWDQGFVARLHGPRSVYQRTGRRRFPVKEEQVPVNDAMQIKIEDEIFEQLPTIFLHHYTTDLRGRIAMRADL
ncbi:phage tail protein [Celerinatantimonas sp. MCCC 1A17872]|uniref:phage tail protein n=1 Tax=Celerinatantimonas sp. MCCC 1A17872 TaxID=3177514 RepID=UPI0038C0F15C